jgi:hypothetical protein
MDRTAASSTSFNLPIGERLPSRNISFGSAEILTIPEVYRKFRMRHPPESTLLNQQQQKQSQNSNKGEFQPLSTSMMMLNMQEKFDGHCSGTTRKRNLHSIRVTGLVLHRVVHADASVSLILGDPLATLQQAQSSQKRHNTHTPSQSTGTKRKLSSVIAAGRTPIVERAKNTSSAISNNKSTSTTSAISSHGPTMQEQQTSTTAAINVTNDRKEEATENSQTSNAHNNSHIHNQSNNGLKSGNFVQTNSLFKRNKKRNLVYVKRNQTRTRRVTLATPSSHNVPTPMTMSKTTAENPLTLLVQSLLPDSSRNHHQSPKDVARVWVISDPEQQKQGHHPVCNVNDLVMVMGEVQTFRTGKKRNNNTTATTTTPSAQDNDILYASDLLTMNHGSCDALTDILPKLAVTNDDSEDTDVDEQLFYVHARIVCIANGTHMKLHTDALQVRRAFLERQLSVILSNN